MLDTYVVFSSHARDRLKEIHLTVPEASFLIYYGTEEKLPKDIMKHKQDKYRERAKYIRSGSRLFTLLRVIQNDTHTPAYLVVSVYDQRMDV